MRTRSPGTGAISSGRPAIAEVAGRSFPVFGTYGAVLVTSPGALAAACNLLAAETAAIDAACSRFRADSEISLVNRAGGRVVEVSDLFAKALRTALTAAAVTDGDVDPTCGGSLVSIGYDRDFAQLRADTAALRTAARSAPGWHLVELDARRRTIRVPAGTLLDLGATAKALAADRAAARIAAAVGCGVLVNLGGDIAVAGQPPTGGWRIEVTDELPADQADAGLNGGPDGTAGRAAPAGDPGRAPGPGQRAPGQKVSIDAGGLATSCTATRSWRRGEALLHHIVVPGTGRPADGCWRTVSVAAASCVDANTASTAAIIRGQERATGWLDQLGLPARLVRLDGTVVRTGGWPADGRPEGVPGWEVPGRAPGRDAEGTPVRGAERPGPHLGPDSRAATWTAARTGPRSADDPRPRSELQRARALVCDAGHRPGHAAAADGQRGAGDPHRGAGHRPGVAALPHHRAAPEPVPAGAGVPRLARRHDRGGFLHFRSASPTPFVPFMSSYKTFWLGLGAVAADLLIALAVTSLLRQRIGHRAWRAVHWCGYLCWPVALVHSAGIGTDAARSWVFYLTIGCVAVAAGALAVRVVSHWPERRLLRLGVVMAAAGCVLSVWSMAARHGL